MTLDDISFNIFKLVDLIFRISDFTPKAFLPFFSCLAALTEPEGH